MLQLGNLHANSHFVGGVFILCEIKYANAITKDCFSIWTSLLLDYANDK